MLYVQEKVVKLGGVYLGGQVTSVEIQEVFMLHRMKKADLRNHSL